MSKHALIIVDMLNDFIRPEGALYCGPQAEAIVDFIAGRLQHYRNTDQAVIFLHDSHQPNDMEFDKFPRHCVAGTWGSQIISELAPRKGEITIAKTRYSGFFDTNLEQVLRELSPELVEVVGVCTSICVMDTVGGLANRDYRILVPKKGVADFDQNFHEFALKRMRQLYGAQVQ